MTRVPVTLEIPDELYAGVVSGVYELGGLVKSSTTNQIRKHLDISLNKKKDVRKALSVISAHKGAALAIGSACLLTGGIIGVVLLISHKRKKKLKRKFFENLQQYLSAAQDGEVTEKLLDNLINSIDALTKNGRKKNVKLNLTSEQLSLLIYTIFDYTKKVAELNENNVGQVFVPNVCSKSIMNDLTSYLKIQRNAFKRVA